MPWTEEDNAELASLVANGLSDGEIAGVLGRGVNAVKNQRARLGIWRKAPRRYKRWEPEDDRDLQEMTESGWTAAECAEAMGRTEKAVVERRSVLLLPESP